MKRAPISASLSFVLACGVASTALAQGKISNQPVRHVVRAALGVSSAEVHIIPTTMRAGGTSIEIGGDRWSARGYDLKTLISQVYDIDARRMDFAGIPDDASADARYDVTLVLPREVDEDTMQQMLKDALERKFRLSITPVSRSMDVYVWTAPNGPGSALHRHGGKTTLAAQNSGDSASDDMQQITYEGRNCSGITSSNGIAALSVAISEFRRTLEPDLDRLLVDETHLTGSYDFKIGNYASQQELFTLLHQQLGILVTPTQRKVTMLTVRPAQDMRAAM